MKINECQEECLRLGVTHFRIYSHGMDAPKPNVIDCHWIDPHMGLMRVDGSDGFLKDDDAATYLNAMFPNYFCEVVI